MGGTIVKLRWTQVAAMLGVALVGAGVSASRAHPQTPAAAPEMPAEYKTVLQTLGKQGDFKANVLKINIPRNDLSVTVAGVKTPTPFGFGGWVAMTKGEQGMEALTGGLSLTLE